MTRPTNRVVNDTDDLWAKLREICDAVPPKVAERLFISHHTVNSRLRHVFGKLISSTPGAPVLGAPTGLGWSAIETGFGIAPGPVMVFLARGLDSVAHAKIPVGTKGIR